MTFQLLLIHKKHQKFLESLSTHSPSKKGIKIGRFFHSIKLLIRQRSLCSQQKYNWIALQLFSFAFIYQKTCCQIHIFPITMLLWNCKQVSKRDRFYSEDIKAFFYHIKLRICFTQHGIFWLEYINYHYFWIWILISYKSYQKLLYEQGYVS